MTWLFRILAKSIFTIFEVFQVLLLNTEICLALACMTIHIIVHGTVDVFLSSLTHLTHTVKVSSHIKNYVFLINF